jgi:uncharacterized membrane-anchored protein YitT (DUF2179 family)
MHKDSPKAGKITLKSIGQILWNLFLMTVGSIICVVAVNAILLPLQFFGAGFTGISLLVHYFIPQAPIAVVYFLLNIPVYLLGWRYVGRRFFLYSIPGMIIYSVALGFVNVPLPPIHDKILAAILAGIIMGIGSGIVLKSLGSAGGLDILSVIFLRLFSVRLGTTILAFNIVILAAGAIFFSLEGALYTLIYIFINSHVVNLVVTGLSQRKAVLVISSRWEEISKEIMEKIHRGVTILKGQGAYTSREQNVLYTIITFRELAQLKKIVRDMDPNALVVVNDTLEVMGQRIGNQPHW